VWKQDHIVNIDWANKWALYTDTEPSLCKDGLADRNVPVWLFLVFVSLSVKEICPLYTYMYEYHAKKDNENESVLKIYVPNSVIHEECWVLIWNISINKCTITSFILVESETRTFTEQSKFSYCSCNLFVVSHQSIDYFKYKRIIPRHIQSCPNVRLRPIAQGPILLKLLAQQIIKLLLAHLKIY